MSSAYKRDTLLNDLRNYVIEIVYFSNEVRWLTLREDLVPDGFQEKEKKFHEKNKDVITAWDVRNGEWGTFKNTDVQYVQIKDGF